MTAPENHFSPNKHDASWDDLDDASIVPTGRTARDLPPDKLAKTDVASGVSLGTGRSRATIARFKCPSCHNGLKTIGYHHPRTVKCNRCKGVGKLKTDPALAAKRKQDRANEKEAIRGKYISEHIAEYTWALCNMQKFDFARSMLEAIKQNNAWTDGQLTAIRRCMARDEERAQAKADRKPDAVLKGAGFERMVQVFNAAKAAGLQRPKLRVGIYRFAPTSARSQHPPGTIFVSCLSESEEDGRTYLGRIAVNGQFFKSRDASPDQVADITRICADPVAAAVAHGKETGCCSCCGLTLTNAESVRLGIGPICREKWGL